MPRDLVSKKTRYEFREYFVGMTLREIEMEFDAADVPLAEDYHPNMAGARRSLVERYYHSLDFSNWTDVRKVLTVYGHVLADLEERAKSGIEQERQTFERLKKWIEGDGFAYSGGTVAPVGRDVHLPDISAAGVKFVAPELHRQIERIRDSIDQDPALAIGNR